MSAVLSTAPQAKVSFKETMLKAREAAIISTVNRLLAEKGFDAMTVDEVAAAVGIAKASLYKHFPSKESLAAAAMVSVMNKAVDFLAQIPAQDAPLDKLKAVARWTMEVQLAGEMPSLPSQNSSLRSTLMADKAYMDGLIHVSDTLGSWIVEAQKLGQITTRLPAMVVLYTLFARACDPVLEFLKMGGQHTDAEIVDYVITSCFDGLSSR